MQQTISLICGGVSAEHNISLLSAQNIARGLMAMQCDAQIIYWAQDGCWHRLPDTALLDAYQLGGDTSALCAAPRVTPLLGANPAAWLDINTGQKYPIGTVVPMVHGTGGEDGALQGLLEVLQVPYVGPGICGCAVSMDKRVTKQLLQAAGLPCVPGVVIAAAEIEDYLTSDQAQDLDYPLFVKPATTGSSFGVSKVENFSQLAPALQLAAGYAAHILLERAIVGRELECAVLQACGASMPGELVLAQGYEFYDYTAKYLDKNAVQLVVPAQLQVSLAERMRDLAWQAARALDCTYLARVDFFLTEAGEIYINEVNAIPGFTNVSMYSLLWQEAGINMSQLLQHLIENADQDYLLKRGLAGAALA